MVAGAALAALGMIAFGFSFAIGNVQWGGESARLFPQIVSLILVILAIRLVFLAQTPTEASNTPSKSELVSIAQLLTVGVVYVFLIDKFGFLIATATATPVVFFLFGLRSRFGLALTAIAVPVGLHVIFFELLGLFPPLGQWFDLIDVLRGN